MTRDRYQDMDDDLSDYGADSDSGHSDSSFSLVQSNIAELYGLEDDNIQVYKFGTEQMKTSIDIPKRTKTARSGGNKEKQFLDRVLRETTGPDKTEEGFLKLYLDNFFIYKTDSPEKAVPLHVVASHDHGSSLRYSFRGTASHENGPTEDLEALEITGVQIDNFGGFDGGDRPAASSCRNAIYLQTKASAKYECYYLLQVPNNDYTEIFSAFQWLATFSKHIHDYIQWSTSNRQDVHLDDFRESFYLKLVEWYHEDVEFVEWSHQSGNVSDFRRHVASSHQASFIYDQIYGISQGYDASLLSQPLWDEVAPQCLRDTFNNGDISNRPTLVTLLVKEAFLSSFPKWRTRKDRKEDLLVVLDIVPEVLQWRDERSALLEIGSKLSHRQPYHFEKDGSHDVSIAALLLEKASLQSRNPALSISTNELLGKAVVVRVEAGYRYAYVHGLSSEGRGLSVRWLLLPSQTVCEGRTAGSIRGRPKTFYPIGNEVFWSDECCCEPISAYKVVAVHGISVLQDHALPGHELFAHRHCASRDYAICEISQDEIPCCVEHDWQDLDQKCRPNFSKFICRSSTVKATTPGHILSLFSGCGLLDLGFEAGAQGLFETIFAADCDYAALKSFSLNHPNRERCEFHNQDVNVLLQEIAQGKRPLPNVRVLIAGCPCQGFSILNPKRDTDKARKNCSMLAHTMSWVDLLRPEMVLIENVKTMDPLGTKTTASAAGQFLSTLVSIGYQARLVTIRASDYGGPTSRERLFIIATIPGIPLPRIPQPSHGMERRQSSPVTASTATLDLLRIDNNKTFVNPLQPDHIPFLHLGPLEYGVVSKIPTTPSKKHNNLRAVRDRLDSPDEISWYENKHTSEQKSMTSSSWCRVDPNKPHGTIVTAVNPRCARSGRALHWLEHRVCSLQEFRRFHGVLDIFILVGNQLQQMHQLGNSVACATSNVLGGAFAEA